MTGAAQPPRVALVTYSTRPRGGVVHAVELAEALHEMGALVHLFALGDPGVGFFRPVAAPHTVFEAPEPAPTLEERVFRSVDALAEGLAGAMHASYDIVHAEDCIAARAALDLRARRAGFLVLRTVHHVDDFTTQALIDCQRRSIVEPDAVFVVSEHWREILRREFSVDPFVVTNGVRVERFRRPAGFDRAPLRRRVGAEGRFLFLTVGGIEPRKGSMELIEALAKVRASLDRRPVLAVVGGHSFQDYAAYQEAVHRKAALLDLAAGRDLALLGTVPDHELPGWYQSADAFVFPSRTEGWGLVVLEAMAAGLPVIATQIPVFREYLTDGVNALLVPPGDPGSLADAMLRMAGDPSLRARLVTAGERTASRYTWASCAQRHAELYREALATR